MANMASSSSLLLMFGLGSFMGLAIAEDSGIISNAYQNSYLYEFGFLGGYPTQSFESFDGKAPRPNIVKDDGRCHDEDLVFVSPRGHYVADLGPIILDSYGNLVWMDTSYGQAMGMDMQVYKDKRYITFWKGGANGTFGQGEYVMMNENYELEHTIKAGEPYQGDLHELNITPEGTALITIYDVRAADMSAFGIEKGWIYDGIFQEIEIATGKVIFTWKAADHFDLKDSLKPPGEHGKTPGMAWDFFHINSVDKDDNGNYIISSRYMCAIACVSKDNGRVLWQLSGNKNSFTDLSKGQATKTRWQHHARYHGKGLISVFNNNAVDSWPSGWQSSGMVIQLDFDKMTAELKHRYTGHHPILTGSQGSVQLDFDRQKVVVGWGYAPAITELTMDGQVLCETHIGSVRLQNFGWTKNYRAFKHKWNGAPKTHPDLVSRPSKNKAYVSWNGDTRTHRWELKTTDDDPQSNETVWTMIDSVERKGRFEVELDTLKALKYIKVHSYNGDGHHIDHSIAVETAVYTPVTPMESLMHQNIPQHPWVIVAGYSFWVVLFLGFLFYFQAKVLAGFRFIKSLFAIRGGSFAKYKANFLAAWPGQAKMEYEAVPLVAQDRDYV